MRRLIGSALALLAAGAAVSLGPAQASAAPIPFVAVDCSQSVIAFKGQPVTLARLAVAGLVSQAVRETEGLGTLRGTTVGVAFPLGASIPVGEVPDGTGEIPGSAIADAVATVVRPMRELVPHTDAAVARVHQLVTEKCGMTVRALNPSKTAPGTKPGAPGSNPLTPNAQPVGGYTVPDQLRLYDGVALAGAAKRDYGSIPFAKAGLFVPSPGARYGSVPGYSPEFGVLSDSQGFRTAGDAQALPVGTGNTVGLPILLAVLALSVVTGALVRTWVLRRA
ncbi:hypothetical protein [Actinokineospora xionganensis]|uniref:Uncharacterized protein n=1 Tax=Actinokineospora xionganensis TaxID=2684470 RepID=A0ABR7LA37_9PSEU|nr:hypothetical protein [Actinokineospora xionganensis]MBC6449167.1 hypothetical protein [Actinokineospora xionganensis]